VPEAYRFAGGNPMIELKGFGTAGMLPHATIVGYLFWLTIAGYLALYVRLRQQGLHRVYRVFAAFLLFRAASAVALSVLPPLWYGLQNHPYTQFANRVYAWTWAVTVPMLWILQLLIVLELYSLVLQNYKGIASMGRWAVLAGLAGAIVLASLALPSELSQSTEHSPVLRIFGVVTLGLDSSLVIFLLFITAFLVWFPIPLSRNVVLYSMVYALYFTTGAVLEFVQNLHGLAVWGVMNIALTSINLLCLGIWIVFLNRASEATKVVVRQAWAPEHQEFLIAQLAAINSSLMRSARQ
jgi:hypothetical protein